MNKTTEYQVRRGDTVFFWRQGHPSLDVDPLIAFVQVVGQAMYLDLAVISRNLVIGRPLTFPTGCVPGDIEVSREQLQDSGTWMPRDEYFAWEAEERAKREKAAEASAAKAAKAEKAKEPEKAKLQPVG